MRSQICQRRQPIDNQYYPDHYFSHSAHGSGPGLDELASAELIDSDAKLAVSLAAVCKHSTRRRTFLNCSLSATHPNSRPSSFKSKWKARLSCLEEAQTASHAEIGEAHSRSTVANLIAGLALLIYWNHPHSYDARPSTQSALADSTRLPSFVLVGCHQDQERMP